MSSTLAFVLGAAAFTGTLLARVRVRHPAELLFVYMMTSWLVGELALFHLMLQALATAMFVRAGVLNDRIGIAGVALFALSMVGLAQVQWRAATASRAFQQALVALPGPPRPLSDRSERTPDETDAPGWQAWIPFWFDHRGVEVVRNLSYGEHRRHRLDIYRAAGTSPGAALPVVIYIHGGAWVIGDKDQQGKPMLLHLARHGYIGVSINHRLGPRDRWPAQIIDVKRAIAWVRDHIAGYGGDPSFIAVSGSSAGGHLATLAALTPGDPMFQPGFEQADASVDACVAIYAPFDLTGRAGVRGRASMRRFLERLVMGTTLSADALGWRAASPLWRVNPDAPPMLVIQAELDTLVWREEAREFVDALAEVTRAPLVFVEVPGAQHAFEVFNSVRCHAAVDGIRRFLDASR